RRFCDRHAFLSFIRKWRRQDEQLSIAEEVNPIGSDVVGEELPQRQGWTAALAKDVSPSGEGHVGPTPLALTSSGPSRAPPHADRGHRTEQQAHCRADESPAPACGWGGGGHGQVYGKCGGGCDRPQAMSSSRPSRIVVMSVWR